MTEHAVADPERRGHQRWDVVDQLQVFNRETGRSLGHLVDISVDGMRILSAAPPPHAGELFVWLEVPRDGDRRVRVFLDLECRWCKPSQKPGLWIVGCRFTNPTEKTINEIRCLVDQLNVRQEQYPSVLR